MIRSTSDFVLLRFDKRLSERLCYEECRRIGDFPYHPVNEVPGMATGVSPAGFTIPPPDLVQAIALAAERDADCVGYLLDALAKTTAGSWLATEPVRLPRDFLLGLGASFRLTLWEAAGIQVHRDAGLPSARDAFLDVFRSFTDPAAASRTDGLWFRVCLLSVKYLAWTGPQDLSAELTLGDMKEDEEDALVNAVAKLLWTHRHDSTTLNRNGGIE